MARRKKQTATKPKPTIKVNIMRQDWRNVAWAVKKDGHDLLANSIRRYIDGIPSTDFVEIAIPEGLVRKVYLACLDHGVGVGATIARAADSHWQAQGHRFEKSSKPVDAGVMKEAMAHAAEELKGME